MMRLMMKIMVVDFAEQRLLYHKINSMEESSGKAHMQPM